MRRDSAEMLSRVSLACLFLALLCAGSPLGCRWMEDKFGQYSESSLQLLDHMGNSSTNSTQDAEDLVPFPDILYKLAAKASAGDRLAFSAQVLREVCALFEEDHGAAPWEDAAVENFLNLLHKQADELSSCAGSGGRAKKSLKLQTYFKRLSQRVPKTNESSPEAWELLRTEVRIHLARVDLLASSVIPK